MFKPLIHPDEIIGFAVLLLMAIAIVAGQADASVREAAKIYAVRPMATVEDHLKMKFDSNIGGAALKISFDVVADLSLIRGEDE